MKISKCEHCIHKKVCIDSANYKNAESCKQYINSDDVVPVKHGKWGVGYFHDRVYSRCTHPDNDLDDFPHNYCPNCGAKMDD